MIIILLVYIQIVLTVSRWIHFLELKNLNSMIFCNLRNTEPVLALRNRHVFTERRRFSNCHGQTVYSNTYLYGVNSRTLILSLQKILFPIFEIENFVLDFWPAFRDMVPLCAVSKIHNPRFVITRYILYIVSWNIVNKVNKEHRAKNRTLNDTCDYFMFMRFCVIFNIYSNF